MNDELPGRVRRCEGKIWAGYHNHQCHARAKVERDGKWFCGVHDPVAKKAREDKKNAERLAKYEAKRANQVTLVEYAPDGSWVKVHFKGTLVTYRAVE